MEFGERLKELSRKIPRIENSLDTEEATKSAIIMPFLHKVLGYDVFNPNEVIPEYTADVGGRRREKVDFAIVKDGDVQILIECKKLGESLSLKHAGQLFRYFTATKARIAILTNGEIYQFYTDLDDSNKMDEKPFLTLNLSSIDEYVIPELKKLTKESFDVESVVDAAGYLKYLNSIKSILNEQFLDPDDDFVKFFAAKVYEGKITAKVKEQFHTIVKRATKQFLNDKINDRFQQAINKDDNESIVDIDEEISKIETTEEELEAFSVVKAILRVKFDVTRIVGRDTQSYFGVLLDDNNRKPLCRFHFNRKQKYVGIFDEQKNESRHPIDSIDDIYLLADKLIESTSVYDE